MDSKLISFCREAGHIYIYGAGENGRIIYLFLKEHGIETEGFLVSVKPEKASSVMGKNVVTPKDIKEKTVGDLSVIIGVAEKHHANIMGVLQDVGIKRILPVTNMEVEEIIPMLLLNDVNHNQKNIDVLCYHRVANLTLDSRRLAVNTLLFERQLVFFKENYKIIRSDEEWIDDDKPAICLTFDDGYVDFYENILPQLEKYKVPATVFVATGNIDTNDEFWGDDLERILFYKSQDVERIIYDDSEFSLTDEKETCKSMMRLRNILKSKETRERERELKEIAKLTKVTIPARATHRTMTTLEICECSKSEYVTIGAHTVNHCCLSSESTDKQKEEIKGSKEELEAIIDKRVDVFAYPYGGRGDFTDATVEIAKAMGFKKVFAAYSGMTSKDFENGFIPRNSVAQCKSLEETIQRLKLIERITVDDYI